MSWIGSHIAVNIAGEGPVVEGSRASGGERGDRRDIVEFGESEALRGA